MRRTAALVFALLTVFPFAPASGIPAEGSSPNAACPAGWLPLFVTGGTAVTNSYFFPGTAIYDGQRFLGAPYVVPQGCNLHLINTDPAPLTNGHQVVSFKRRHHKPVFRSAESNGPDASVVVNTANLEPGVYPYFCVVHFGMFGLLQIR